MKSVLRSAKNFTKGYSDIQVKVREATSNEEYGPTMTQLDEIARASFNPTQFSDIIYIIDKRLNDHGKNWRHVYKTLLVVEYGICCGADSMVTFAKERLHEVRTLREFISIDDHGNDNGACVREKSKDIVALLTDDNALSAARRNRNAPIERRPTSTGPITLQKGSGGGAVAASSLPASRRPSQAIDRRKSYDDLQDVDEDTAMAMALEESKAVYESGRDLLDHKDSGYPAFLEHASRSSSQRNSTTDLSRQLSAEQLLDLDDESFVQALDKSCVGSRRDSNMMTLDNLLNATNTTPVAETANPFEMHYTPALPGASYVGAGANGLDPFAGGHAEPSAIPAGGLRQLQQQQQQQQSGIHPIAMPGMAYADLNYSAAKPVMPGSIAPQFGNKPARIVVAQPQSQPQPQPQPAVEANEPSGAEKDPFADLL